MYKFVRDFKKPQNNPKQNEKNKEELTDNVDENQDNNDNPTTVNLKHQGSVESNTDSSFKKAESLSSLSTLTTTNSKIQPNTETSFSSANIVERKPFLKIKSSNSLNERTKLQVNKNESESKIKDNKYEKNTTSSLSSDNKPLGVYRSSSTSSLTTLSTTTITNEKFRSSSSSSSSSSSTNSSITTLNKKELVFSEFYNETNDNNNNNNNKEAVLNELENQLRQSKSIINSNNNEDIRSSIKNINFEARLKANDTQAQKVLVNFLNNNLNSNLSELEQLNETKNNYNKLVDKRKKINKNHPKFPNRTQSLNEKHSSYKMVLNDNKNNNNHKKSLVKVRNRNNLVLSSEDEERNATGSNNQSLMNKNDLFRDSKTVKSVNFKINQSNDRRAPFNSSQNRESIESSFSVISQPPFNPNLNRVPVLSPLSRPKNYVQQQQVPQPQSPYFAQIIGQSSVTSPRSVNQITNRVFTPERRRVLSKTDKAERIIEISSAPQNRKRIRSPSNGQSIGRNSISSSSRDYHGLLNLAHNKSRLSRQVNKIVITPLPRSLSVNYLYRKRQGDLRRYQNSLRIEMNARNHPGFTTEDIDDIYMPKQLDMFERKLKASLDISDNSESEEARMRHERLSTNRDSRLKKLSNKRIRHDYGYDQKPTIIINYTSPRRVQTRQDLINQSSYLEKKSYLEEAKRKLDEMRTSKGYYYNLNNKLKSSVTNLIKASQDLARTSEIRQRILARNLSLHELYDIRKNQIRSNNLDNINSINTSNNSKINDSYTCDDIDNVYMPWMMENYGRKLAIEALKRRGNMLDQENKINQLPRVPNSLQKIHLRNQKNKDRNSRNGRNKSPYVSQYYAQFNDSQTIKRNDLWLIDKEIRRYVRKSRQQQQQPINLNDSSTNLDTEVSITDSETSSDDTRPIVPEKINKPDVSLKNKILKSINKSLFSSDLTGIDLNMLKLNDSVRRTLKRIEKKALERDLDLDLIRSFSFSHLADLRKEDIKYNMKIKNRYYNSYTTEDIEDLYMPKVLEAYKLKIAIEKERKGKGYDLQSSTGGAGFSRISSNQSPIHLSTEYILNPTIHSSDDLLLNQLVTTQPPIQIKSPLNIKSINSSSIATPLSPTSAFRNDTDNLFRQIIQERLSEFDHRMANEISSSTKNNQKLFKQRIKKSFNENVEEEDESDRMDEEEAVSTDHDQDDSLEISSSESDDLNMNEEDLKNFETSNNRLINQSKNFKKPSNLNQLSKSKIESAINKSLTLRNPGELISDFYISNMNYAMRYSVEYIQQVAKDIRRRREQQDSSFFVSTMHEDPKFTAKLQRSFSVDRLYAVRREHIRYSNGADGHYNSRRNISFTTDDIQDIYMPSALDNYKRKIAVELERRRRLAETDFFSYQQQQLNYMDQAEMLIQNDGEESPLRISDRGQHQAPVILDDLDIFIIKNTKTSIENNQFPGGEALKTYHPVIQVSPNNQTYRSEFNAFLSVKPGVREVDNSKLIIEQATPSVESVQLGKVQINKAIEMNYKRPNRSELAEERIRLDRAYESVQNKQELFGNYAVISNVAPTLFDFNKKKQIIEQEEMQIDQANVSVESFQNANNYPLINKINTIIDNEILQENLSSSSSAEDSYSISSSITESAGSSDTLSNINLENFEPRRPFLQKNKHPPIIEDNRLNNKLINREPQKANLVPGFTQDVAKFKTTDLPIIFDNRIKLDQANANTEPKSGLASSLLISHPPAINKSHETHQVVPNLNKPQIIYDNLSLHLANVNIIKPINLATQSTVENKPVYSNFIPPEKNLAYEANYKFVEQELNLNEARPIEKVNILNAPSIKEESFNIQEAKLISVSPRLPISDPEYIIEEFAKKPLHSSITYSYENTDNLPSMDVSKLNLKNANQTISAEELKQLDSKSIITTLNAPIINQENQFVTPQQLQTTESISNLGSTAQVNLASVLLNEPAHALIPVDVKKAKQIEYEEHELVEFVNNQNLNQEQCDSKEEKLEINKANIIEHKNLNMPSFYDINLSNATPLETEVIEPLKLKENKQLNETIQPAEWIKRKVYNLPNLSIDTHDISYAHPFTVTPIDLEMQQLSPRENIQSLQTSVLNLVPSVLNLATQQSIINPEIQTNEIKIEENIEMEQAIQKDEITNLNSKPLVSKVKSLNAPIDKTNIIEELMADELETGNEEIKIKESDLKKVHLDELEKPLAAKKPVFFNKAQLNESITSQENVEGLNLDLIPDSESLDIKTEESKLKNMTVLPNIHLKPLGMATISSDESELQIAQQLQDNQYSSIIENIQLKNEALLNSSKNINIIESIKHFNLGQMKDEQTPTYGVTEYNSIVNEPEVAVVKKEDDSNLKKIETGQVEFINRAISNESDEFLESVKPMDTIELNFEELINIQNKRPSIDLSDNKFSIQKVVSLNRAQIKESKENFLSNNFEELNQNQEEIMLKASLKENVIDLESPNIVKVNYIKGVSLAKIENDLTDQEESIEFEIKKNQTEKPVDQKVEDQSEIIRMGQYKAQLIFNSPLTGQIEIETTQRYEAETLDYERPKFNIEKTDLEQETRVEQVKSLNAPIDNLEVFQEQQLEKIVKEPLLEDIDIHKARLLISADDCNLKVGIDHRLKFNLASLNESISEEEDVKEDKAVLKNLYENANENINPVVLNTFSHGSKDISKTELKHYGLSQEIIEINETDACDDLIEKVDIQAQTSKIMTESNIEQKIDISNNLIRNSEVTSEIKMEECERLDPINLDYYRPIHNREPNELLNAEKSKTIVLSSPEDSDLNISVGNVEILAANDSIDESKALISREVSNLTNLERIQTVVSINMPNLNDVEYSEENLKEFKENVSAEKPFISRENNEIISVQARIVSLLNAPKYEYLNEDKIERTDSLKEFSRESSTLIEKSTISKETIDTNLARTQIISFLNAPKYEYINENGIERADSLKEFTKENISLMEKPFISKEIIEINSAHKISFNLFNAPKYENINLNTEKADNFVINTETEKVFVGNENQLTEIVNIRKPVRMLMKESEEELENTNIEKTNELLDRIQTETVEIKNEICILNNKPDKQLLLWLNYPRITTSINQQEETTNIDEKLDYLYEKIAYSCKNENDETNLETDSNLIHIERVLNLFISNQDQIEFHEEILKYLPNSRPEVQRLILNRELQIEFEKNPIIYHEQVQTGSPADLSFEQDSIEESNNKPYLNKSSSESENDESKNRIKSDSSVVFNLASLKSFFNPNESLEEFINQDLAKNVQPTIVNGEVNVNKVTQQTILNAPKISRLEQDLEETWELVAKDEMKNVRAENIIIPIQEAYSQDDVVFWENLQEKSESSIVKETVKHKLVEQVNLKSIEQEEVLFGENFEELDQKPGEIHSIEPRISTSLGLNNVDLVKQPDFNCDTISFNSCWDEHEIDFKIVQHDNNQSMTNNSKVENQENVLDVHTDDDTGSFFEQLERYEIINSEDNQSVKKIDIILGPSTYSDCQVVNNSYKKEEHSHLTTTSFQNYKTEIKIENTCINCYSELNETATNKWDQVCNLNDSKSSNGQIPINIKVDNELNDSASDHDSDSTTSSDNTSTKIHLIESVEILTHPTEDLVHIHKVDINQLKIKEKPNKNDQDPKSRFKVNFKQEELVDLRADDDERLDLATNKVFAKKFVEQIIQLSSSKLENHLTMDSNYDDSNKRNDDLNFDNITNKTTSEILESLTNLKCDIGKHFTDSIILDINPENIQLSEQCYNLNLVDDYDSSETTQEDYFEHFSNRLHSSSNYDKLEEEFNKDTNRNLETGSRIPIEFELEKSLDLLNFNSHETTQTEHKENETVEIFTQIVKEKQIDSDDSSDSDDSLNKYKSTIALDSMKSYLDNILNVAVKTVDHGNRDVSDQDDETSIQDTITINKKNE